MGSKQSSGISEADNEAAGRLLMFGALAIVAVVFLLISPILVGGFLIGLIWYGAYIKDGDAYGGHLTWPIVITLAVFLYLVGSPVSFGGSFQGVLFTDFWRWTDGVLGNLMRAMNEVLPRKFMIRSISAPQMRLYIWAMLPAAMATLTYLHFRGKGGGQFLYQGFDFALTPFRRLCEKFGWLLGVSLIGVLAARFLPIPYWINSMVSFLTVLMIPYGGILYLKAEKKGSKKETTSKNSKATAIDLGVNAQKPHQRVKLTEDQLNHHVHIVGASGFGKSVLLSHILRNRINSGGGVLFMDLKADIETITQVVSNVKNAGRLDDLYLFSCANPEISRFYNVLARGSANQLKDRIMSALTWSEEFYRSEASSFLLKILRGLTALRDAKGNAFDLSSILDYLRDPREIAVLASELPSSKQVIQRELEDLASYLGKADNLRALQGLKSQLESLLLSDFGHLLKGDSNGINLLEAIRSQKIVYILLDSRTYGESSKALGKLILQDLKAASAQIDNETVKADRVPFSVIVDEFADLATEDFVSFLDRARSSKIGVVVAHQEIADLERISPEFARRMMNSTSSLFAFLQKLPDSSELIAGIAGTRKTKEVTEQAKSNWLFGDEKTGMKSIKEVDEFIIHPNVIKELKLGVCVLIQKYPKSDSFVIRVNPEVKDHYMPEGDVREILEEIARKKNGENKRFSEMALATKPATRPIKTNPYWENEK